jgi:Mrp family chromosome partitioning ATPase
LQQREVQVRTIVRGPRELTLAKPSAWETNILADLEDPQIVAPLEQLLVRWRQERAGAGTASLLIASLAAPMMAAEVALRSATLITRQDDASVLVIDADPDAALSRRLGIVGKPGLGELLSPHDAHGETIHPTATPRLHVLPRGRSAWPASVTLADVSKLLDDLGREYTWLLVTTGDAGSPGAQAFARACRGAYIVAPLGQVDAASAEHQMMLLRTAGARILGALTIE